MYKFIAILFLVFGLIAAILLQKINTNVEVPTRTLSASTTFEPPTKRLNKEVLWNIINDWRVATGRKPYERSQFLCEVAETRVQEAYLNFSHQGFNAKRFCTQKCDLGENLSVGVYKDEEDLLHTWLDSPSHREILEQPYQASCIDMKGTTTVQIFGSF